jgi:hypothetical protein
MEAQQQEVFTQDEVTAIIRRALAAQGNEGATTYAELEDIALQSGVSATDLREAIVLEQEARDREEARKQMRPAQHRFWIALGVVHTLAFMLIIALMAQNKADSIALIGWMTGSGFGLLLVRALNASMERSAFRKLQERRARREAGMRRLKDNPGGQTPQEGAARAAAGLTD